MSKRDSWKIFFSALFFCACVLSFAETVRLTVIQTSDIHAQTDGRRTPGIARLATVVRSERRAAGGQDHTLLIDCGDLFQGSWQATLDKGASLVSFLNHLDYDAFVPGNHDFDFGTEEFAKRLNALHASVLAFNLKLQLRSLPARRILPWKMFEKNSLRIAVIGMTSPFLFTWLAGKQTKGLRLSDYRNGLAQVMGEVMEENPDLIVLAMHNGLYMPARLEQGDRKKRISAYSFLKKYPQIDLVLGGHSHQENAGTKIASSWYIQAPPLSGGAAVAEIVYDREKRRIVSLESRIAYAADAEPDPEIISRLRPLSELSRKKGTRRIARLAFVLEPLKRSETENRLSRMFGQAILRATGAKIAFHGTLSSYRSRPGILYASQVYLLAPYENLLAVMEVTPSECRAILSEQLAKRRPGSFLAPCGISYRTGKGGALAGGLILDGETKEWREESRLVKVAVSSYALAGAGGRFPVLKAIGEKKKVEFPGTDVRSALEKYLSAEYPCSRVWMPDKGEWKE